MIPVFITARLASTRLPRKHLLKLGNYTVIEHVYLRCKHFGFEPTICVPVTEKGSWMAAIPNIKFETGHPDHIKARLFEVAGRLRIKKFHHLDGDDPFFNPVAIKDNWHNPRECHQINPSAVSAAGQASMGTLYDLNFKTGSEEAYDYYSAPWPQRLTLDYEEDYHLLCAVNRMVGGYMAPRWAVDELFVRNPDLHKINWFRTDEWKARQLAEC